MSERFPRSVYRKGTEPDPRFSLANERTFLAWIRTALALLAAGVALEALQIPASPGLRMTAALIFVALGVLAAVQAWIGWMRAERAMRENTVMPSPAVGLILSIGMVVAVIFFLIGLLI